MFSLCFFASFSPSWTIMIHSLVRWCTPLVSCRAVLCLCCAVLCCVVYVCCACVPSAPENKATKGRHYVIRPPTHSSQNIDYVRQAKCRTTRMRWREEEEEEERAVNGKGKCARTHSPNHGGSPNNNNNSSRPALLVRVVLLVVVVVVVMRDFPSCSTRECAAKWP